MKKVLRIFTFTTLIARVCGKCLLEVCEADNYCCEIHIRKCFPFHYYLQVPEAAHKEGNIEQLLTEWRTVMTVRGLLLGILSQIDVNHKISFVGEEVSVTEILVQLGVDMPQWSTQKHDVSDTQLISQFFDSLYFCMAGEC